MNQTQPMEQPNEWEALILAGARGGEANPVAAAAGVALKAFVPIGGRAMVVRVAETLRASGGFARIRISLPEDVEVATACPDLAAAFAAGGVERVAATTDSPAGSVAAVLADLEPGRKLLVTTADHPLLDVATVRGFQLEVAGRDVDAACALVRAAAVAEAFPDSRRTALRFREEAYVGCNLFALTANAGGLSTVRFWQQLEVNRKHPVKMAAMLGWPTLLRFRMHRLGLDEAAVALGRKVKAKIAAIEVKAATAGVDVDSVEDLELVRGLILKNELNR